MQKINQFLQKVCQSVWFDVLGIAVILYAVIAAGYELTPLKASWLFNHQTSFWFTLPMIGIVSTLSAIASVMSTRLTAKMNNLGNIIGWLNTIASGTIDFLLGNVGAVLTYPVSIILNYLASKTWAKQYAGKLGHLSHFKTWLAGIIISSFVVGFGLNYVAYVWMAHWDLNALYYLASLTFSLSLVANGLNVFKLPAQWPFWGIYNFVQLGKAIQLRNVANIAKYIYYIINAIITAIVWEISKLTNK